MAEHGGKRPGSGRPKGSRNKRTREQQAMVEKYGKSPLEFLLESMNDESREYDDRLGAAKAAAPYIHAKLSSVEMDVRGSVSELTDEELDEHIKRLASEAGISDVPGGKGKA